LGRGVGLWGGVHICTGTGLAVPHLHRDWAHLLPHLHRDCMQVPPLVKDGIAYFSSCVTTRLSYSRM
jgi:hypothetical protein